MNGSAHNSTVLHEQLQQLKENLKELSRIAELYGIEDESTHIHDRIRDSERGLMVLVTGEGNFGKSSLINAIAGKYIAPVEIVPNTFKVDIYSHSPDGQECAVVRRIGDSVGARMEIKQAQSACDEEEEKIKQAQGSQPEYRGTIADIEWFLSSLQFDSRICLVDTPGIAQFFLKNATVLPERLVKGLGATYYVEDVWEMWYHRADIVLWCFEVDRLGAVETHNALKILTQKYHKTILPVITKVDKIPEDKRSEIDAEFQKYYGDLFSTHRNIELHLTICKDFQNPGANFKRLLETLTALAIEAQEQKLKAIEESVVDFSRHLESILRESVERVISNLQVIADTADEIAIESIRLIRQAIEQSQRNAENFFETKISGLEAELWSIYAQLEPFDRPKSEMKAIATQHLRQYLEEDRHNAEFNAILDQTGEEICNYATAISRTKDLKKVRISSSLRVSVNRFSMQLHLRPSDFSTNIKLLPIELPGGCLMLLSILGTGVLLGVSLLFILLITVF